MRASRDGFDLTFTEPVDPGTAGDIASYRMKHWTYYLHSAYGCPPVDTRDLKIETATVAADGKSVHLVVAGLKAAYVHELRLDGVRNRAGNRLLHPEAYYTLNRIPE